MALVHLLAVVSSAQSVLASANQALLEETRNPANKLADGRLSPRGVQIIEDLFASGQRDAAICNLMDITSPACCKRRATWRSRKSQVQ
jgi:hypothetical protein